MNRDSFVLILTWEKSTPDSDLTHISVNSREQMMSEAYRPIRVCLGWMNALEVREDAPPGFVLRFA